MKENKDHCCDYVDVPREDLERCTITPKLRKRENNKLLTAKN